MSGADDRTLATSRWLPVPPSQVFRAIAEPQRLARWWGPAGFCNHFEVFEFRPGGRWIHTMEGPDGTRYPNQAVFEVVEPDQRVVVRHVGPDFRLHIALAVQDQGTRLDWRQTFDSAEVCAQLRGICEPANEQNLDRLLAELGRAGD